MYYIFEPEIQYIQDIDALNYATALSKMPNFLEIAKEWSWWSDSPLPVSFPNTTFSVDESIYQDAYQTGSIFYLHSEKLADQIRMSGTRCEYFPVEIVSRKSGKKIPTKYFAFHHMETYDGIDYSKSTLVENVEPVSEYTLKTRIKSGNHYFMKRIAALELTEEILSRQTSMFRDSKRPRLTFIYEKLKQKFDLAGITGCKFTHYKDFRDITLSDIGRS